MFSKAFLVAFLYLSFASSAFAAPTNDFFGKPSSNKGSSNTEQCGTAVQTVTVTAATTVTAAASVAATSAAATLVSTGGKGGKTGSTGNKGGNNAGNGGAAGNNKGGASSAAAATSTSSSSAAASTSTAAAGGNGGDDAQTSLTLDPSVIAKGFEDDGQDQPAAGQVASLTSSNNFINFCKTVPNLPITNGQQIKTGSCNPAPMGIIAATTNMPSSKFVFPQNMGTVQANTAFTVQMAISNLETGHFVNANENYFSAPQQVNSAGQIQGHSHIVIEAIDSLTSTTPTDPTKFAFFKGLNDAAQGGVLSADVTAGLPAGTYRMASINTAANHQPVLVAVAQHGAMDDMIYFTVTDNGAAAAGNATSTGAAAAASSSAAAAGKGAQAGKGGAAAQKGAKGKN
ncbi:hypothetical protein PsYK624_166650 [Phanerochaete sordida]|uniref:Uncharacterized protein n=1 Tax=Phanerochaete sordida TaxID=48140 RepID=A0A9P3LNX3_9APHY|nr:hypothetical protein PsYK624_166650 [Phanerochaete sordida]